jgi:hypothetical protein
VRAPYAFEPDDLSPDTVECLTELLARAKRKEIIGISFAVILKRRNFWVNTAGEARRSPVFAMGTVGVLYNQIGRQAEGSDH